MLKKSQHGFSAHLLLPVVAIVTVLGSGGYLAKHYYDMSQQRKEFITAKAEVTKLGEAIARETKPTKHKAVQFCDYGHAKWGPVGRTCWAEYFLQWNFVDEQKAIDIFNSETDTIKKLSINYTVTQDGTNKNYSALRGELYNLPSNSLQCDRYLYYNNSSEHIYYDKYSLPGLPFQPEKNSAIMKISCSGDAMAEYFPVRKS